LPRTLVRDRTVVRVIRIVNRFERVKGGSDGVGRNVRTRYSLTRSTGGGARTIVNFHITSRRVSRK
jgi:hypothetical protein